MRKLVFAAIVSVFLLALSVNAQEYFTELNGFRLRQYREVTHNELGSPFKSEKFDDGGEYEAFLLKPDGSLYMIFEYAADQTDLILNIQVTGTDASADLGFRGMRFGMPAAEVERQLGAPSRRVNVGEHGTCWEYDKSNFSVEINTGGKLSSIKIKDISDKVYPTLDLKKLPRFDDVLKTLTTGTNAEIANLVAPDAEVYREGSTIFFGKSIRNEIAADHSRVFAAVRALANELKTIDPGNILEYEENARLSMGKAPAHVMKFKKGKIQEIVFKYRWGKFVIWEFNAGKATQADWAAYAPGTLKAITTDIVPKFLKAPDVITTDAKKAPDIALSYDSHTSKISAVYTGQSRKVSQRRKAVIEFWLKTLGKPIGMLDLFEDEYLFTENDVEYWLPVQKPVTAYFALELKKGDTVLLYIAWLGGRYESGGFDNIFLVNEFEEIASPKGSPPWRKRGGSPDVVYRD